MKTKSNAVKGFTLIEMMMVLAIAAVMITVAVPSFRTFTQNAKLTKQVNLLAASISTARGEAAKRGQRVVVCQTADVTDLDNVCEGTAGTWSSGWIIFSDADNDESIDVGTDVVVGSYQTEPGVTLLTDAGASLVFNSDGSTREGNSITFAVCDSRGVSKGKELAVATTGRASSGDATTCTP